ncbi:MAG: sensor histidine kinase [Candidatus Methylomirabilia bacterium]
MPSLRRKVSYGYYAVVALLLGLSAFVVVELRLLERRIVAGEAIAEFFDATLEIRRFEKNYFLYDKGEDFNESMRYAGRARELLSRNSEAFGAFVFKPLLATLRDRIPRYELLLRRYAAAAPAAPERVELEREVRRAGKEIVTLAEDISGSERRSLQLLLARYRRGLVGAIVLLSALAIAIGQVLAREVVRPLRALEQALNRVAEGRYDPVAIGSRDREIVSLTNALNRMLRERELHERHLIQSEKLASLGTLLSGVAHELNNPLSNISTSAQILAEEMGTKEGNCELAGELVGQIGEQTDRARNIVRSLLEFSRDREFRKEPLLLRPLVEETVRFLKGQIPPGVSVEVAVPAEITLLGDRQRLQQVFLNLVKNAAEAVPPESGRVVVSARRVAAGGAPEADAALVVHGASLAAGDVIEIEVLDNGPGIPPQIRKKIFDPFFTTKDVGKGSGLGLFVVYEIVEEHDGSIAVENGIGGGTLFSIRLPA